MTIDPVEDVNPVQTQHTFTVKLTDSGGKPVPNSPVMWTLQRFPQAVGDIVWGDFGFQKVSNDYAVSKTNDSGQATLTIVSTREGDTDVFAFSPDIVDPAKHKVFARKHWVDMKVNWPVNATNVVGNPHTFIVQTIKATTGEPLEGYNVRWTMQGSGALFTKNGSASITTITGKDGRTSAEIGQVSKTPGEVSVLMEVLGPYGTVFYSATAKKSWVAPTLKVTKEGPATVNLSADATYTITVTNSSTVAASNVVIKDTLPDGLTYVSSSAGSTASGQVVTWNQGVFAPGATSTVRVTAKASRVGDFVNNVSVTSDEGAGGQASAKTKVVRAALVVTKAGPPTVIRGSEITYDIVASNTGDGPATGVVVVDTLPDGVTYLSSTPSGSVSGKTVTWSLGDMAAGGSAKLQMKVRAVAGGDLVNVVKATSAEKLSAEAQVTTRSVMPAVSVTKTGPDKRYVGVNGDYTITVTNSGEIDLHSVTLKDLIPAGLSFVSSNPAGTAAAGVATFDLGTMTVGQSKVVTVTLKGANVGTWINTVEVTTAEGATARSAATTQVYAVGGMSVTVIDSRDPVPVGDSFSYTITIKNTGTIALHGVVLSDLLPNQLTFVSAFGPVTFTVSGNTVTFQSVPVIDVGGTLTFTITVKAVSPGPAVNKATMTYAEFDAPVTTAEGTTIYQP